VQVLRALNSAGRTTVPMQATATVATSFVPARLPIDACHSCPQFAHTHQALSSPYDIITQAELAPSPDAAQPTVAKTTQVCVYDRPNTRTDGDDRSTEVPQPHGVQQDVDDVVALIGAARLPGPFVFVAHSYGGLILDQLARTRPDLVAGLVMVDPTSEFLMSLGSPAQNAAFERDSAGTR